MNTKFSILVLFWICYSVANPEKVNYKCEDDKVKGLKVFGAFRVGHYIGLFAEIHFENLHQIRGLFRVFYAGHGDPEIDFGERHPKQPAQPKLFPEGVRVDIFPYYGFTGWDILGIDYQQPTGHVYNEQSGNFDLMFVFSTNGYNVAKVQSATDIVYVNDTEGLTAYQISTDEPQKETTFKVMSKKVILNTNYGVDPIDDKDYELNFYQLFLYFPRMLKINAVLILNLPKTNKNEWYDYLALVYTTERFQGKDYHYRHKLKARKIENNAYESDSKRFTWNYDRVNAYCDHSSVPISAAVLLHRDIVSEIDGHIMHSYNAFYIMEFFGLSHRIVRLTIDSKNNVTVFENVTTDPKKPFNAEVNNTVLIRCKNYTFDAVFPTGFECNKENDEYIPDEVPGYPKSLLDAQQVQSDSTNNWLIFGSIIVLIIIINLIAFGMYFITSATPAEPTLT